MILNRRTALLTVSQMGKVDWLTVAASASEVGVIRPGFKPHSLTVKAADHMTDLVDCAIQFRMRDSDGRNSTFQENVAQL